MKMLLLSVGKTTENFLSEGVEIFRKRIERYILFETEYIAELKNAGALAEKEQKNREGEKILKKVSPSDYLVLLDDKGKHFTSTGFAEFIGKRMYTSGKKIIFVVGGPYGFSDEVYARADERLSLSRMTFTHQMVRLVFVEQLYRAFTILNNEPYHHQ